MKRLSPASQPSPVMQVQEDGENLIPFAKQQSSFNLQALEVTSTVLKQLRTSLTTYKDIRLSEIAETKQEYTGCSRVVSRSSAPNLPSQSLRLTPQHYGDIFWDNLSQRPSSTWMEEQYIPSLLRDTGCSQPGVYPPEGLPPPEMLFRRKRRRSYLTGMQGPGGIPARVRAVTYHLEDLRRRQRVINELKKGQWSSSGTAAEPPAPLVPGETSCGFPSASERLDLEEEGATYPQEKDHLLPPGRPQLLWSPWSPLVQEGSFLSRQLSSLTPYSTVSVSRSPLSHAWGVELPEE